VDLYGNMPDFDSLADVADRHNVAIIEDAAEAIGSELRGRRAGGFGVAGVFSFHGSKTLTTGEGGMLVTNRKDLRDRALVLRDHGRPLGDRLFYNREVAWKYKMSALQAALGLAQLERVGELVGRKREIFGWYQGELAGLAGVTLNHEAPGVKNSYWMVTVLLDRGFQLTSDRLMELLHRRNIDCRPFFHPLSSLPAYANSPQAAAARARNRVSYHISPYALNLPSALNLTPGQVRRVCDSLKEILRERNGK
jgi:perosamine synthetase